MWLLCLKYPSNIMQTTMTDLELRSKGVEVLTKSLGTIEAERFIAMILREPFDYTRWRQPLFEDRDIEEISEAAAKHRNTQNKKG